MSIDKNENFCLTLPIKEIYKNKKNKKLYVVLSKKIISSTNKTAGTICYLYTDEDFSQLFCRERDEFVQKFELVKELNSKNND